MQAVENTEQSPTDVAAKHSVTSEEDSLRAQIYRLLAGFLSQPPTKTELKIAADLVGSGGGFGAAIDNFAKIASKIEIDAAGTEYHDLFIGVTRGELLPYGSYYQTGFLNEKPLANLRSDMAAKGIAKNVSHKEPEDHVASVLEMMAGLIEGAFNEPASLIDQKHFFEKHVNSWTSHFFKDLEQAKFSVLYAPLGTIGRLFMEIEQSGFEMVKEK